MAIVELPARLVEGFLNGDEAALNEVVRMVWPELVRYCFGLGAAVQDAEEITNDVLRELFANRTSLRPEHFVGAMFKTCKYRYYDWFRARERRQRLSATGPNRRAKDDEEDCDQSKSGPRGDVAVATQQVEKAQEVPFDEAGATDPGVPEWRLQPWAEERRLIEEISGEAVVKAAIREAADRDMLRFTQLCFPQSKRALIRAVLGGETLRSARDLLPDKEGSAKSAWWRLRRMLFDFAHALPRMQLPEFAVLRDSELVDELRDGAEVNVGLAVVKSVVFFLPVRLQPLLRELLRDPEATNSGLARETGLAEAEIPAAREQAAQVLMTLGDLVWEKKVQEEFKLLVQEVLRGH